MISPEPHSPQQGAFRQRDGSVVWNIWAPLSKRVHLVTWPGGERTEAPMTDFSWGFHTHREEQVEGGLRYAYLLENGQERPDPASRWQPEGVNRPSAVFTPEHFQWTDQDWKGIPRHELVIYELHVGTFTPEGTFDAVILRLPQLKELGVTALELMPIAQFSGDRNWGYDGVHLSAAQNSYGGPHGLQRLVDAAHRAGLAVLLDVVYNHIGPEGNYLSEYGPYFTDRYRTPWGSAVNYDGPDSDPVRQFVCDSASQWVRDFHIDGLRLDAVQMIYDCGARHILAQLQEAVQETAVASGRMVHVIAETNQNDVRLTDRADRGGYALDGVWSDDFHHSLHSLLTGEREGYYFDYGAPEHLVKAFNDVFVYDGNYSPFRRRRFGRRVGDRDRTHFVVCIKNHDQVGNRALGDRFATLLSPEAMRLASALLMLSPCVPLVFMGTEYGETRPFAFFCSFSNPDLIEAVRRGRRQEFTDLEFDWAAEIPDPQSPETFEAAKLTWEWPAGSRQGFLRKLNQDLLTARRTWPALRDRQHTAARLVATAGDSPLPVGHSEEGAEPESRILVVERGRAQRLLACANFTARPLPLPPTVKPEQTPILSTEADRYGGSRALDRPIDELGPYELIMFGPEEWQL